MSTSAAARTGADATPAAAHAVDDISSGAVSEPLLSRVASLLHAASASALHVPHLRSTDCRGLYNAIANGILIVDTRDATAFSSSHAVSAVCAHADDLDWTMPDDPRTALLYGTGAETAAHLASVCERITATLSGRVLLILMCRDPFASFAAAFPFAVTSSLDDNTLPPLPSLIEDGLWLGSALHASDPRVLDLLHISHVVCVMDDVGGADCTRVSVTRFAWVDTLSFAILPHLPAVVSAIDDARARGGVLVHCYQGKSRSAAAVAAWLLSHQHNSQVDAIHERLREARHVVCINTGFLEQLHEFASGRRGAKEP